MRLNTLSSSDSLGEPAMPDSRPCFETMLDPQYLQAIGDVIARWSFLEVDIDHCLFHFLLRDPQARKLSATRPKEFKRRMSLFRDAATLGFEKYPAALSRFLSIADKASQLRGTRDEIAHGRWMGDSSYEDVVAQMVPLGNWSQAHERNWPLERIEKTAHEDV